MMKLFGNSVTFTTLSTSLISSLSNPIFLYSSDGSIMNIIFPIIPFLQSAILSPADCCVAAVSSRLRKGLVNNRPWDSSLPSSTSSVWKPFLRVDADWQGGLWGGGVCPFHCGPAVNAQRNNHTLAWAVIGTCIFAKTNTGNKQIILRMSLKSVKMDLYAVFSSCA